MTKPARTRRPDVLYANKPNKGEKKVLIEAALDDIYSKHGIVNQQLLVDYARPASSPIHDQFEWDDRIAGEKWRETQALHMIIASKFVIMLNQSSAPPPLVAEGPSVRKLLPALSGGGFKMRYEVLEDKDARTHLIELKKKQLQTWCRETTDISELGPLRAAILALL